MLCRVPGSRVERGEGYNTLAGCELKRDADDMWIQYLGRGIRRDRGRRHELPVFKVELSLI